MCRVKASRWCTFSKCRAGLGYYLTLGPFFWECLHLCKSKPADDGTKTITRPTFCEPKQSYIYKM